METVEMLRRSLETSESNAKMVSECMDTLIPTYFYMGFAFGCSFKTKNKFLKNLKKIDNSDNLKKIFEKGEKIYNETYFGIECKKCGKKIIKEENENFCKFCGEKL